jgi:hypothetical protein
MAMQQLPPTNVENDLSVGTQSWSLGSVEDDDGVESSVALASSNQSRYLLCTNCGFTIPSGATIDGMLVSILRRVANGSGGMYPAIRDAAIYITYGAGTWSANLADTGTDWPVSETEADYGGPTTNLAPALTAAEVNHASFGVLVSLDSTGGILPDTAYIDRVMIQIHYTEAADDADYADVIVMPRRRVTRGVVRILDVEPSDDPPTPPDEKHPGDITLVRRARAKRGRVEVRGVDPSLLQDASATTDEDGWQPEMIIGARRRASVRHGRTSIDCTGLWEGDTSCDCPPGGVVIVADGYAVEIIDGAARAIESHQFAVEVVSEGWGGVEVDLDCNC